MKIKISYLLKAFLLIFLCKPGITHAQQMVVDDAALAKKHVIEGWAGTEESLIQPAFVISRAWNLNPGIIFNTKTRDFEATNWLLESKIVPPGLSNNQWSVGNVSAVVFNFDGNATQIYSFFPVSKNVLNYNSFLHLNLGFEGNRFGNEWDYDLTMGFRADFGLTSRIVFLSEIFSYNLDSLAFQTGFHFVIIPGQLASEVTYGHGFEKGVTYPGFNVGVSFIPY